MIPLPEGAVINATLSGTVDECGWLVLADGTRIPPEHYAVWITSRPVEVLTPTPPVRRSLWDLFEGHPDV